MSSLNYSQLRDEYSNCIIPSTTYSFIFLTVPKGVCVSEGVEFKVGLLPDTSSYELMLPESELSAVLVFNPHTKSRIRMACNFFPASSLLPTPSNL